MNEITKFKNFESEVMEKLLDGDDPILEILRVQYSKSIAKVRDFSGVGFFTTFEVDDTIPKIENENSFFFGDVIGEIEGLKNGVGFVLFVKNGAIHQLEGYTYDENWPENIDDFRLIYSSGEKRNLIELRKKWL